MFYKYAHLYVVTNLQYVPPDANSAVASIRSLGITGRKENVPQHNTATTCPFKANSNTSHNTSGFLLAIGTIKRIRIPLVRVAQKRAEERLPQTRDGPAVPVDPERDPRQRRPRVRNVQHDVERAAVVGPGPDHELQGPPRAAPHHERRVVVVVAVAELFVDETPGRRLHLRVVEIYPLLTFLSGHATALSRVRQLLEPEERRHGGAPPVALDLAGPARQPAVPELEVDFPLADARVQVGLFGRSLEQAADAAARLPGRR